LDIEERFRADAEREKYRVRADCRQALIILASVTGGIFTVAAVVSQITLIGIAASLFVATLFLLRAERLSSTACAYIDASTEYLVFYRAVRHMGVPRIRAMFSNEHPKYARFLKQEWDSDTTFYPDV
jgi:hypothetical protein